MLELENGLLTFMEMLIMDKVDLIKVTLVSIMSFQYLESLIHLLCFRFFIYFFNWLSWTQISCYNLSFLFDMLLYVGSHILFSNSLQLI